MKTILYIKFFDTSFVNEDEKILKKFFDVQSFTLDTSNRPALIRSLLGMSLWLLGRIGRADAVYAFFVSWYLVFPAFLCRLIRVPLLVTVAGFDANYIPLLKYGIYHERLTRVLCGFVYRRIDVILPLDRSLIRHRNDYSELHTEEEGFKNLFGGITGRIVVIPSGFDTSYWKRGSVKKRPVILTIGGIHTELDYELKGMSDFVGAARRLPRYTFIHIGENNAGLIARREGALPDNLSLLGYVDDATLLAALREAKVYAQLSVSEGLPNALIQAMLCECVPVGSSVNGIPDIIGDAGFIVSKREPHRIDEVLINAMESNLGPAARRRAVSRYSIRLREEGLYKVFTGL